MPRRELEVLDPAGDLAERVGGDLAVLGRQVRGDLVTVRLDQVPDLEHDVGALGQRGRAPGGERGLRRRDGRPDFLDRGQVDVPGQRAGRGVVDGAFAPGRSGHDAATDPVADSTGGRCF